MIQQILSAQAVRRACGPVAAALLLVAACSRDQLLEVATPDQITPELAASAVGANALRISAIGNFAFFYGGDYGGSFHGLSITSGLLSDEMEQARGGTEHVDSRAQNDAVAPLTTTWSSVGQANTQIIRAIKALKQYAPEVTQADKEAKATQIGQLYALRGMLLMLVGETYCNAVPIGDANDADPKTEIFTNAQLWTQALAQFDLALTTLGNTTADAPIRTLVAVGRGRTLLDQGKFAEAGAAVTGVATNFVYNVFYSTTVVNAVYDWMNATLNYAPADREGGNGLAYVSANDPRVTVRRGTDGTPTPRAGQDGRQHFTQTVFALPSSPIWLASGVEARLIEAEAALKAADNVKYLAMINAARATRTDLPALALPATQTAREDLLFSERAFWFWGTSHRLGDMRRLIRQYSRATESVFPTGSYFAGGTYGTDVSLVPSQAEKNNVAFTGCSTKEP
jgi:hypothetical protein